MIALVYASLLLVDMPTIVRSAWGISDGDIDGVLAKLSATGHTGWLSTGDFSHYETMAFALLTRSLPFYRTLWQLTPVVCLAIALVAFFWCADMSFGRWPAAIATAAVVCLGYNGVWMAVSFDSHGNAAVTAVVCAAACVSTLPRIAVLSLRSIVGSALLVGVLGGLVLAGDALYLVWGLLPVVAAAAMAAWRAPTRLAPRIVGFGFGAVVISAVTSWLFAAVMHSLRVTSDTGPHQTLSTFFTGAGLVTNIETLIDSVQWEMTGTFGGLAPGFASVRLLVTTTLLVGAAISVVWVLRRDLVQGALKRPPGGHVVTAATVHTAFWATALAGGVALFLIGSPAPAAPSGRYLLGAYVALAALLPLLLRRATWLRMCVTCCVGLFCLGAVLQLLHAAPKVPSTHQATALARYARRHHVAVAYAYYADSLATTWATDFRLDVFPVQNCPAMKPNSRGVAPLVCAYDGIANSEWYRPRSGQRSMLVIEPQLPGFVEPASLTPIFGKPLTSAIVGQRTVLVYRYDIAARMPASY